MTSPLSGPYTSLNNLSGSPYGTPFDLEKTADEVQKQINQKVEESRVHTQPASGSTAPKEKQLIGPEAEIVVQTQRKLEHENNKVREPSRKNVHSAYQQALKLTPESIETSDPREHLDIYS